MKMRIKALRKALKLKQADLAARAGYRVATISELENNKGNPELATLEAVAGALGVPVMDLFEDDASNPSIGYLLREIAALPSEQRQTIRDLVRALQTNGDAAA